MLVMGVTAALGLAIYALGSSTNITKQIIATGLAREGLEALKDMRDTNWLLQTSIDTNCHNYVDSTNTARCYKDWLGKNGGPIPYFCIDPQKNNGNACNGSHSNTSDYFLGADSGSSGYWTLISQRGCAPNCNFGLRFDKGNSLGQGFYHTNGSSGVVCGSGGGASDFCRKIIITQDPTTAPYNQNIGPLIKVQSRVWWVDKKCPRVSDWSESAGIVPDLSCRVEMVMYLTNWKGYQ
jgi:hypothetical protein